jgi:hypothetical protein
MHTPANEQTGFQKSTACVTMSSSYINLWVPLKYFIHFGVGPEEILEEKAKDILSTSKSNPFTKEYLNKK